MAERARADEGAGLQGPAPRRSTSTASTSARARASPTGSTSSCAWSPRCTRWIVFRARGIAAENVPGRGPGDPRAQPLLVHGPLLRRRCSSAGKVRFMAKSQLFTRADAVHLHARRRVPRAPRLTATRRRSSPPRRSSSAAARSSCTARAGARAPGKLVRAGASAGIGRLALETGAPVVPVAIHGSPSVRNWKRLQFPKVTVQYGEPIRWERVEDPTREQQQAVADEILERDPRRSTRGSTRSAARASIQRLREQRRAERRAGRAAPA